MKTALLFASLLMLFFGKTNVSLDQPVKIACGKCGNPKPHLT